MEILVVNGLSALRGGGQTYLINLLDNLAEGDFKIVLIVGPVNKSIFIPFESDRIRIYESEWASRSILHRSLWERFKLPKLLKEWKASMYYAPGGVMVTKMPGACLSATALQNMLPFDDVERRRFPLFSYSRLKLRLLKSAYVKSYKLADKVVFISNYSMNVAEGHVKGVKSKGCVIPHGLNKLFLEGQPAETLPRDLKVGEFYLYVSILDVYKAQKEVVQDWARLISEGFDYPLVLVGPKYNKYGDELIDLIAELGLGEKVIYLGPQKYEDLPSLYRSARALIFASSCECCPNILLEKMAAGRAVLCSDIEPMPEFGQDAVMYFDPYLEGGLAEQLLKLEASDQLDAWGEKAQQQALKFDWEQTSKKTFDFLMKLAKK